MPLAYVPLIGRLGNCLFIYAHARAWCEQNGYELCMHPWVGEKIFNIPEAVRPRRDISYDTMPEETHQYQKSLIYTRKQVREWFSFKPEVLERLKPIREKPTKILFNLRHDVDHLNAKFVVISKESYVDACVNRGYSPIEAEWETDTEPTRLPSFGGDPWASGYNTTGVCVPSFYRLMLAPVLFRANSTFSWWAATLGNGKVYSPIIRGMEGGVPDQYCPHWVEGNWPVMVHQAPNTDLHLAEE